MDVSINTLSEVQQEAEIRLSGEELQPRFEKAYEEFRPKAEIKGFRKGKVPLAMVKKMFGDAIERDALDNIAGEFYEQVMEERHIHPIGQPALVDMDFKRGEHFMFKIKYEVKPEIRLASYKGITVEKPIHTVTDAEVNAEVAHLRQTNSTMTTVSAVTDREHLVTADVQELDDTGTPLIGKKTSGMRLLLSDEALAKEIGDALKSAEVGGEYRATFESRHGDHTHPVHVVMSVKKIEKVHLPEFDDEFVRKITGGKTSTAAEFLTKLRDDLGRYWAEQSERKVAESVADEMVRMHEFTVPDSLVEGFIDTFVEDVRNKSKDRRLPASFDEKKFRDENRAYAVWQAKWMLIKEQIAQAEKITVTDAELETLAETEAARAGIDKERLVQYYKGSSSVRDRVVGDKILALLKDSATIKEKVVD